MRLFATIALVGFLGCSVGTPTLQGTWRSSRDLTLIELARATGIEPKQRAVLERPTFFGELVLVIDDAHITTILPYHEASDAYRVLESGDDFVAIESIDAKTGERQEVRCRFRDDQLLVPVPELGFHEVFVRVTERD